MRATKALFLIGTSAILTGSSFGAEVSLETAPPVVVKSVPVAGASNVDPALTEIRVTFSKAMRNHSWSWSTWGEENYPETTGRPHYEADGRTCVLPVKLQPGKFYATWLNSEKFKNFKDTTDRPAVPYLLTFTTAGKPPSGAASKTDAAASRKFVRVVLDDQKLTFEGRPATWDTLDALFSAVPDRKNTVLEWAVPSTQITIQQQGNWTFRFAQLAKKHGFEYSSYVGVHPFGSMGGIKPVDQLLVTVPAQDAELLPLLNDDQKAVLAWTDRQFRSFFDRREFDGWSKDELAKLESRLIDALDGPRSTEYYQAINTLAALGSTNALPRLRQLAFERVDKNNRDRWMSVRALGIIGDRTSIPELIHLVYHGNQNTRWWAQITLVRLTGQNFGGDWEAWGTWWNDSGGQPPYNPEIIRWWSGQPEPDELAKSLAENNQKFLADIKPK